MIHSVEIAFLFISFKRLRLEREQIRQLLDLKHLSWQFIDLWHEFHIRKAVFKAREIFGSRGSPASDHKIAMSLRAASQILNKMKDFFESLKHYLRM